MKKALKVLIVSLVFILGSVLIVSLLLMLTSPRGLTSQPVKPKTIKLADAGTGKGQVKAWRDKFGGMHAPLCFAIDWEGNYYIGNTHSRNILKFSAKGKFLKELNCEGKLSYLMEMGVDPSGNIYTSLSKGQVLKFDSEGNFLYGLGPEGKNKGEFDGPRCLLTDSKGNIYVSDQGGDGSPAFVFDKNGNKIGTVPSLFFDSEGNYYKLVDHETRTGPIPGRGISERLWSKRTYGIFNKSGDQIGKFATEFSRGEGWVRRLVRYKGKIYLMISLTSIENPEEKRKWRLRRYDKKGNMIEEIKLPAYAGESIVDKEGKVCGASVLFSSPKGLLYTRKVTLEGFWVTKLAFK